MLTEKIDSEGIIQLFYHNRVYMGDVLIDVDGYYKFWPDKNKDGYWDEESLYSTAEYLKSKNADWDREVNKYFEQKGKEFN